MIMVAVRRAAIYARVSSEDQRQRRTIETQISALKQRLEQEPDIQIVDIYIDDGISGTIPMAMRPAGKRVLEDAAKGLFNEVWVYKIDRLGRDEIDPLIIWRQLEALGVKVFSATEGFSESFMYSIYVAMAAKERRTFLERSASGMERIVKNGHFPGGICALGYEVSGEKNEARIIPSTRIIWDTWTATALIVQIYNWLAVENWSCPRIANYLNALGVPTAYQHVAPGVARAERKTGLQAKWRAGRIRNIVIQTAYKGLFQYGKRSKKKGRQLWEVQVPALVSEELWQAAQEALTRNRLVAKNTPRHYLLTGLIKCGECGKTYCAAHGRDEVAWWRCNGRMTSRYDAENRCRSKMIKGEVIEKIIWQDIERWLFNPGDILKELEAEKDDAKEDAVRQAEIATLETSLTSLEKERKGYLRQNAQGLLPDTELQGFLSEMAEKRAAIEKRLAELTPHETPLEVVSPDLLEEIRERLGKGLSDEQRQEIARLLVKQITIHTKNNEGERQCSAEVEYRFIGAVNSCRGRGSWRLSA